MKIKLNMFVIFVIFYSAYLNAQERLEPIRTMKIGKNRECRVNGKPFFPIMSWAQTPDNFSMLRSHGINTFCGNQRDVSSVQQSEAARNAGGYAVAYFESDAIGNPYLLAWIHHDEPDLTRNNLPRTSPEEVIDVYLKIKQADDSRLMLRDIHTVSIPTYPKPHYDFIRHFIIRRNDVLP